VVASDRRRKELATSHSQLVTALMFERVILIVLDSVGIGAQPDAADYGDTGRDTLGHICEKRGLKAPNFALLGLGNIRPLVGVPPLARPTGSFGKATLLSPGKDTTAGHWEMAGIILDRAFPTYPHGFPRHILEQFEQAIGRKTLGNYAASRQGGRSSTPRVTVSSRSPPTRK